MYRGQKFENFLDTFKKSIFKIFVIEYQKNLPYISFVGTIFYMITNCFEHITSGSYTSAVKYLKFKKKINLLIN